jgi:amidase
LADEEKDYFQFGPELGLKTTVGAVCFAEEKTTNNAEVIEQVSDNFVTLKAY